MLKMSLKRQEAKTTTHSRTAPALKAAITSQDDVSFLYTSNINTLINRIEFLKLHGKNLVVARHFADTTGQLHSKLVTSNE